MGLANILPLFNSGEWSIGSSVTVTNSSSYDLAASVGIAWEGVSLWGASIISQGDMITMGCTSISENTSIYVWVDGTAILELNSSQLTQATIIPAGSSYDITVSARSVGTISVTGLYLYKGNTGDSSGSDVGGIPLNGWQIGYKKPNESNVLGSNYVTVNTASALTSAISNATAGQTIYVRGGTYSLGTLNISKAGTSSNYITVKNYPNETPVITGSKINFTSSCKYLNFEGFLIKDLTNLDWDTCVSFNSGSSYINFRNNEITNIKCKSADNGCNPLVLYGDSATNSINNINVENNYIHDCSTGWSEAITCNGNVEYCNIVQNTVDNNGNIGIDLAGNFSWTGTVGSSTNQARFITVARNLVSNCNSTYATSAGLYCDGGRDNIFEYNVVYHCQCGIELGAEEGGATVENFHVRNNLVIDCGRSIGIGGYQSTSATHRNTYVYNNTFIGGTWYKEKYMVFLENTSNVNMHNNIFYAQSENKLLANNGGSDLKFDYNCWYHPSSSLPSQEGAHSFKSDPLFVNNTNTLDGDYSLKSSSPCIDKGINAGANYTTNHDITGANRIYNNAIDIGCYEYGATNSGEGGDVPPQKPTEPIEPPINGDTGLKEIYKKAKDDFDSAYATLRDTIIHIISDGKYEDSEQTSLNAAFDSYRNASANYKSVETQAIDYISQNKADSAKNEAISSANTALNSTIVNYYTKNETDSKINVAKDSITQSVSSTYATKTDVTSSINGVSTTISSLQTRVNAAEQKITDSAIVSTVTSSSTYQNDLANKTDSNKIISTINQTAEAIKIQASKIQLDGATTIGSDNKHIKIEEANYSVFNGSTTCLRFGYKNWNGWNGTPELLMGYSGFSYTNSATSNQNGSYFGMSAWGRSNNPESASNSYHEMYYRCGKSASQSQIKMYEDGVIKIDAVKTLELFANKQNYVVIDSSNGLTFPKGVNEFGVIDGTVWLKNYYFGVKMGKYGSAEDFYFCKATDRNADLGHSNYRWRNIYATNGTINTSDINLKENIEPIVSKEKTLLEDRNLVAETSLTKDNRPVAEDYYEFVKNLPLYTYDYKNEEGYDRSLHNVGFIAQDIAGTAVGDEFIFKGEDGVYQYNMQGYVGVLAVALQNAIKEIENLKEEVRQLKTTF